MKAKKFELVELTQYNGNQNYYNGNPNYYNENPNYYNENPNYYNENPNYYNENPNYYNENPNYYNENPNYYNENQNYYNENPNYYNENQNYYNENPNYYNGNTNYYNEIPNNYNENNPKNLKRPNSELPTETSDVVSEKRPKLEGDDYLRLKKTLRDRKKIFKQRPRLSLWDVGQAASLSCDLENRVPLFLSDIQHLIMYSQLANNSPYSPSRWCQIEKPTKIQHTCVLIVEGVSMYDFVSNESCMPFLSSKFKDKLEIINSEAYNSSTIQDLLMVPLTSHQLSAYVRKYRTLAAAAAKTHELFDIVKNVFHIKEVTEITPSQSNNGQLKPKTDKFPRTDLLMSGWQMVEENYPLPIVGLMERKYRGYVTTKDEYKMVTANSPMFGVDCEMCVTTIRDSELTRVSIVDEQHNVIYDTLVKPYNRIIDYVTEFSGITEEMMIGVTTTLQDVQHDLRKLLPPDAILVGQSLNSDLHALKVFHPYVIDTSIIYNLTGERMRKTKLQLLAQQFLQETIQNSTSGHCSTEDSIASLKLVQHKLTQNVYYGDAVMSQSQTDFVTYEDMSNSSYATNLLRQVASFNKQVAVYSTKSTLTIYKHWTNKGKPHRNIKFSSGENKHDIIGKMINTLNEMNLSVGHVHCAKNKSAYRDLDELISKLCREALYQRLYVIVFAGSKDIVGNPTNGCAFLAVI